MVIGNGLIAKSFLGLVDDEDFDIFAAGVSDSTSDNHTGFLREERLLLSTIQREKKIIYFSTCSIYDYDSINKPYVAHKLNMEALITEHCQDYIIFRLPQVVGWTKNPHTIINYLAQQILEQKQFNLWKNAYRNLIDVEHVRDIVLASNAYANKSIINIANPRSIAVQEIVAILEVVLKKSANFRLIDMGSHCLIDTKFTEFWSRKLNINFSEGYAESVLRKYYEKY